jgi:hypothetical protein
VFECARARERSGGEDDESRRLCGLAASEVHRSESMKLFMKLIESSRGEYLVGTKFGPFGTWGARIMRVPCCLSLDIAGCGGENVIKH